MKVYAQVPQTPNFVTLLKDGGIPVATGISIAELADEDIVDLGKRWTEALLESAKQKRAGLDTNR